MKHTCQTHGKWDSNVATACPTCLIELRRENVQLKAERDRLAAVVSRLPVTADGVPTYPGMKVYSMHPLAVRVDTLTVYSDADNDEWQNGSRNDFSYCYATKDAAKAAFDARQQKEANQ